MASLGTLVALGAMGIGVLSGLIVIDSSGVTLVFVLLLVSAAIIGVAQQTLP